MPYSLARTLPWFTAVLVTVCTPVAARQEPPPPALLRPASALDPVTVRGCLEKRWLTILEHDATDLSGVKRVRLKASRAMLALLDDGPGRHVEITGELDLGRRDRIEARRKYTPGSKTTISIGASAENVSGGDVTPPDVTLVVASFTRLGDQCPSQ
jgi:hypothetical protein